MRRLEHSQPYALQTDQQRQKSTPLMSPTFPCPNQNRGQLKLTDASITSVSVVIPVFNSGSDAIRAIASVQGQHGVRVHEIIVVDDGSTDDSAQLITSVGAKSGIPVKVHSIQNGGAANARNFGMSQCSGNFLAFLDSDDRWLPEKLDKQMAIFGMRPEVGMVGCLTNMGAKQYSVVEPGSAATSDISLFAQLFKNHFQTSTVIVRRSVVDQVGGFPLGQRHAEEGDFFNRIAASSPCVLLREVLVDYSNGKGGFGESGLSANLVAMERGELRNLWRAYRRGHCNALTYACASTFSMLKFLRRLLIKSWRKALIGSQAA